MNESESNERPDLEFWVCDTCGAMVTVGMARELHEKWHKEEPERVLRGTLRAAARHSGLRVA